MSKINSFSASGSCNDKDALKSILKCILPLMNCREINGYMLDNMINYKNNIDDIDKNVLVIKSSKLRDNEYIEYPYKINCLDDKDLEMLASHICMYIHRLNDIDIEAFGCTPSGYEEDCELGWELFTPDWYSNEMGIQNYNYNTILAVKPKLIEYGK